jgi:hypothetical protein
MQIKFECVCPTPIIILLITFHLDYDEFNQKRCEFKIFLYLLNYLQARINNGRVGCTHPDPNDIMVKLKVIQFAITRNQSKEHSHGERAHHPLDAGLILSCG